MTHKDILIILLAIPFAFLVGMFIYNNIIVPWPYRHDLKACLEAAQTIENETFSAYERNICFRTYPHFN